MDHSLPYLLAVALLDGDVMALAQFKPDRIIKSDVQALLKKVSVGRTMNIRISIPGKCQPRSPSGYRQGTGK